MRGLMQDYALTLPPVFDRFERLFADKQVVWSTATERKRTSIAEWADRTRRFGGVLDALGVPADGRVGTFAWNTADHLSLYWAAPCTGRILHTLNIRLFPDQLTFVVNHAEDDVVFVDRSLLGAFWKLADQFETVRHVVVMDDGAPAEIPDDPRIRLLDDLIADAPPARFAAGDENQAASMCYTSGTTGNPKGVVYSHRSVYLHSLGVLNAAAGIGMMERDRLLPVVPMFHANAWGWGHAPLFAGAELVLPGPQMTPSAIAAMLEQERVTMTAGVPTIWMGVLPELDGRDLSALRAILCGGSAVPKALSEAYREKVGMPILHAWGMTETSPLGSINGRFSGYDELSEEEAADVRSRQGIPPVGVEARIVEPGTLTELPWDDKATGELQVCGPWIAADYYRVEHSEDSFTPDGWLRTGDVGAIALVILAVDEVDEAFANIYSTATSAQNVLPRADRRLLALLVGALATVLALAVDGSAYEPFLFLIGAVFVPLAATVVVDFRLSRGEYDTSDTAPARWAMLGPWLAGFVAYQLTAPTVLSAWPGWESFWRHGQDLLHVSPTNGFSASLVALVVAAALTPVARLVRPIPLRSGSGR